MQNLTPGERDLLIAIIDIYTEGSGDLTEEDFDKIIAVRSKLI